MGLRRLTWHFSHRHCRPAGRVDGTGVLAKNINQLDRCTPDTVKFVYSKIKHGRVKHAEFKKILLDWTVKIANAIIDGTRSAEDAKSLRFNLTHYIEEPSKSPL